MARSLVGNANSKQESTMSQSVRARWIQLVLGLVCMMFHLGAPVHLVDSVHQALAAKFGVTLPSCRYFSLLVFLQAFLSPFQGSLIDRFGCPNLISLGTIVAGSSWISRSYATARRCST